MNINRDNYEEYFLLYADNELSKTEKKVVEIFVQENPDLKEEFLMIQLTVNTPAQDVTLLDKSFLFQKEAPFINENNYEEVFVLYQDNELSEEKKKETQHFIADNSKYKTDFELIGKAKLIPENSIVYPAKKQLYRKEKSGKAIPIILWRSLAAAVFIGFGVWITFSYLNKKEVYQPVATTTNNNIQKSTINETKSDTNNYVQKNGTEEKNIASTKIKEKTSIKKNESQIENPVLKEQKKKEESIASNEIKTKNKPVEQKMIVPKPDIDYQLASSDKPVKEVQAIPEKTEVPIPDNQVAMQVNNINTAIQNVPHAQTVSYVSNADDNNQNYVFYDVPAENFRKSKVGGFLKKVKRVVERNNPITRLFSSDDEQVVAK